MKPHILATALLIPLVQACGGGAGGDVAAGAPSLPATVRLAAFDSLTSRLEELSATATLPSSGNATYRGYIGATLDVAGADAVFLTADAEITAQFGTGTISGSFANLIAGGGAMVTGSGTITNGTIGLAGIDADVNGSFTVERTGYSLDGTLDGAFLGPGAEGLVAAIDGTVRRGGTPAGTLSGELWAER